MTFFSTRVPPLAAFPALPFELPNVRKVQLENAEGLNMLRRLRARRRPRTLRWTTCSLRAANSTAPAMATYSRRAALVGVRGVGYNHDGLYYIKTVKHTISHGQYKQQFTLTREGKGSTVPLVLP